MEQRREQEHGAATDLGVFRFETPRRGHCRRNPSHAPRSETPATQVRSVPQQIRHAPFQSVEHDPPNETVLRFRGEFYLTYKYLWTRERFQLP